MEKCNNHGGKREGAGRKASGKVGKAYYLTLSQEATEKLKAVGRDKSEYIERLFLKILTSNMEAQIMIECTEEFICRLEIDSLPQVGETIVVTSYSPTTCKTDEKRLQVVERVFGVYNGENIKALDVTLWCKYVAS